MSAITINVHGTVAPEVAWERYARPELWSTWSPQIMGVEGLPERLRKGATGTVRGPAGLRVGVRVLHLDERARTWEWVARVGLVRLRLEHAVLGDGRGGTRTSLTVHGFAPVVVGYLPLAYLALARLVRP